MVSSVTAVTVVFKLALLSVTKSFNCRLICILISARLTERQLICRGVVVGFGEGFVVDTQTAGIGPVEIGDDSRVIESFLHAEDCDGHVQFQCGAKNRKIDPGHVTLSSFRSH